MPVARAPTTAMEGKEVVCLSAPARVLTNGEEPAVRIPDVQQIRSPTVRIARTIDEHALSLHNQVEILGTEDDLERQAVLIILSLPKEYVGATAIDRRQDAIVLFCAPPFLKANPSASQKAML